MSFKGKLANSVCHVTVGAASHCARPTTDGQASQSRNRQQTNYSAARTELSRF